MNDSLPVRGQSVKLKMVRESVFPDGQPYYVLEDSNKRRFLLPAGHYRHYGLLPGQEVIAVVDHINCNGRIFLEPEHPRYKPGTLARFSLKALFVAPNGFMPAVVSDGEGIEYNVVFPPGTTPPGNRVLLSVRTIHKGQVFLEWPSAPDGQISTPEFPVQADYQGTYSLMDGHSFHLLMYDGVPALVQRALYTWFHPVAGQKVECLLYGNNHGTWRAEPEPPDYPFGARMPMKILSVYAIDDLMRGLKHWAEGVDAFDRNHTIQIGETRRYELGVVYPFRVSGYKNGAVVWEEL